MTEDGENFDIVHALYINEIKMMELKVNIWICNFKVNTEMTCGELRIDSYMTENLLYDSVVVQITKMKASIHLFLLITVLIFNGTMCDSEKGDIYTWQFISKNLW